MSVKCAGLLPEVDVIFEKSRKGRRAVTPPQCTTGAAPQLPESMRRKTPPRLPEIGQPDLVRHYTNLSRKNFGVDSVFYPLGSCTMKHNPKINETTSALGGFAQLHPFVSESCAQGMLKLCHETQRALASLTGLPGISLQPAAGAHGELSSMLIMRAWFRSRGENERRTILIPDTAHGTNPASAALAGFTPREIASGPDGQINIEALKAAIDPTLAGIMITNPNTLGLFEKRIVEICHLIHEAGGLVYMDGANFNAIMGVARPGDFGIDLMHLNLHKTFSTPHGGGGPGAGPIAVSAALTPFLPKPVIIRNKDGSFGFDENRPQSIGRMRGFYGNLSVVVRAYTYIRALGLDGMREAARTAVLNANYLRARLSKTFDVPYNDHCMHEFVICMKEQKKMGAKALDFAKALIDCSIHPPTIYFPLIVHEAVMIEPTETESRETLDRFGDILEELNRKAAAEPTALTNAPVTTPVSRLDELAAARTPILSWQED